MTTNLFVISNNFSRNTRIVRAKNVGKKTSEKSAKKRFLYSHEYRTKKMGGKNARNNFSRNTRIVRPKKEGKNRRKKVRKSVFYIRKNIATKNGGKETRETIFPETHE